MMPSRGRTEHTWKSGHCDIDMLFPLTDVIQSTILCAFVDMLTEMELTPNSTCNVKVVQTCHRQEESQHQ